LSAGYDYAIRLFVTERASARRLPTEKVEQVVLAKAMEAYDGASNGNRMRGGMKRASDMYVFRSDRAGSRFMCVLMMKQNRGLPATIPG